MRVVSGPVGKEKVHYEAPAAPLLEKEMSAFLAWGNDGEDRTDKVLRAALAHLWFVTIHPFDDGNGRIARAVAHGRSLGEQPAALLQHVHRSATSGTTTTTFSGTQKGTLDVTPWIEWFLLCLGVALDANAEELPLRHGSS